MNAAPALGGGRLPTRVGETGTKVNSTGLYEVPAAIDPAYGASRRPDDESPFETEPAESEPAALPELAGSHALLVAVGLLAGVVGITLLLPAGLRAIALGVAFVAGVGLERYRQDHAPLPPGLVQTPGVWWWTVRHEIGIFFALFALALTAAAVAVITLSVDGGGGAPQRAAPPSASGGDAGAVPELLLRRESAGEHFTAGRADFRVFAANGTGWAAALQPRDPGPGRRWVAVGVSARAVGAERLNPATLSFRLRDSRGQLYYADQQGTVGPPSLSEVGFLRPGQSGEVRLGFRVSAKAKHLAIEFEPRVGSPLKIRVSLPPS